MGQIETGLLRKLCNRAIFAGEYGRAKQLAERVLELAPDCIMLGAVLNFLQEVNS